MCGIEEEVYPAVRLAIEEEDLKDEQVMVTSGRSKQLAVFVGPALLSGRCGPLPNSHRVDHTDTFRGNGGSPESGVASMRMGLLEPASDLEEVVGVGAPGGRCEGGARLIAPALDVGRPFGGNERRGRLAYRGASGSAHRGG